MVRCDAGALDGGAAHAPGTGSAEIAACAIDGSLVSMSNTTSSRTYQ